MCVIDMGCLQMSNTQMCEKGEHFPQSEGQPSSTSPPNRRTKAILAKGKGTYIKARSEGPEIPSTSDAVSTDSSVRESEPDELEVSALAIWCRINEVPSCGKVVKPEAPGTSGISQWVFLVIFFGHNVKLLQGRSPSTSHCLPISVQQMQSH